jgi:uncharacterized membrane-anchored protein YhcB (DUF1043 family)
MSWQHLLWLIGGALIGAVITLVVFHFVKHRMENRSIEIQASHIKDLENTVAELRKKRDELMDRLEK